MTLNQAPTPEISPAPQVGLPENLGGLAPETAGQNPELSPVEATGDQRELELRRLEIQEHLTALGASDDFHTQAHQQAASIKGLTPDKQLEILATLAFEKGAAFALRVAEKIGDPAVLDQLHDYLVRDDVYPHLDVAKKMTKFPTWH